MTIPRFSAPAEGRLSDDMVSAYRRDGVLVLEDFVSGAACNDLIGHIRRLVETVDLDTVRTIFSTTRRDHAAAAYFRESGDKIHVFFEEGAFDADGALTAPRGRVLNKIGHAMHDLDEDFDRFSRTDALANVADGIGLNDPGIVQSMVIFKQPRIGGEVVMHQDATFLHTDPVSVTGFWFALEDADCDNGCLYAIPGGHKAGLKERFHYSGDELVMTALEDTPWSGDPVPLEAKKGTLVVLHGLLPHWSGPNLSDRSRQAYVVHAVDKGARWSDDNWLRRPAHMPLSGFRR